jgi:pimeloyl-ACP methyl ester carboxylesterase
VLCGHSYAGIVITAAADRAPDRVRRLVYLDAFVPEDGQSWWDLADDRYRSRARATTGWLSHRQLALMPGRGDTLPPEKATRQTAPVRRGCR